MRLKAWLEILRLPNLFTVPGDPVVGYLAASAGRGTLRAVAPVAAAALFLYAAGLLFNDLADIERDRRSRPSRPLPSGRLDAGGVAVAASGLPALALIFCIQAGWATAVTGLLLLAAILAYDFFLKERGLWGAVMMGICRGLSVMLGASVAGVAWKSPRVMTVCGAMAVVVGAVTYVARVETGEEQLRGVRWLVPAAIVVAGVGVLSTAGGVGLAGGLFFAGAALGIAIVASRELVGPVAGRPAAVGAMVGGLIPLQCAFIWVDSGGAAAGVCGVLVVGWFLNRWTGRRISGS